MHVRKKVEKSRFTVFFQWFVAPEGRKVDSLKWRVVQAQLHNFNVNFNYTTTTTTTALHYNYHYRHGYK